MPTLETSPADLEQQLPSEDEAFDEEFEDEDDPESRDAIRRRNAMLPTVHLTIPAGVFSGWGPRIANER